VRPFAGEPVIQVGILEGKREVEGFFAGPHVVAGKEVLDVPFLALASADGVILSVAGREVGRGKAVTSHPRDELSTFSLRRVTIGRDFHWEREEEQTFRGSVSFHGKHTGITVVNRLPLEQYLESVVGSEMSDEAPAEFLKAHAVMARSWVGALLVNPPRKGPTEFWREDEIIRWYGREVHSGFHVCGDDHCQRYQGIGRLKTGKVFDAVRETRGLFLTFQGKICDARYHKACGGRTEPFENVWEERKVPYLRSVSCGDSTFPRVKGEDEAARWMSSPPPAFCGEKDLLIIKRLLNDFDRETGQFFRWAVQYDQGELSEIVKEKSGMDFGAIKALRPLARGPSGRIYRLEIVGEKRRMIVGKELEIRRWLSRDHLLSSAFIVKTEERTGHTLSFHLWGAGWGHGVGLCQVGAAVMAIRGASFRDILGHYFRSSALERLY